jgi:hypothetical protein
MVAKSGSAVAGVPIARVFNAEVKLLHFADALMHFGNVHRGVLTAFLALRHQFAYRIRN